MSISHSSRVNFESAAAASMNIHPPNNNNPSTVVSELKTQLGRLYRRYAGGRRGRRGEGDESGHEHHGVGPVEQKFGAAGG